MTPDMIGPQTDGTNLPSPVSIIPQPTDTAGGAPAQYTQQVLDLFKFGIGAVAQNEQTRQMFDYKKFEATNGGLYQQGRSAAMPAAAQGGGTSGLVMMGIGAIVVFALLTHKG
ncbi:MAG: hypothetical protein WA174_07625, partial [Rhodoferax sp.]